MWVMLPVIFSNPGIVSDFERLSDKALKPSLAGEWPGCKMVFSNSLLNCSCFLFQLTISCLSFTVPLFTLLFFLCVNSSKPNYGFFLSISLSCVCTQNTETPLFFLPVHLLVPQSASLQITHIKCKSRHFAR